MSRSDRAFVRAAVSALVVVLVGWLAAGVAGAPPAAGARVAETCAAGQVTVVVEPGALGGTDRAWCADAAEGDAAFAEAGVELTYASRFPGLVCRVDDRPRDEPCVAAPPGDAYWGLFVSDDDGPWQYATLGVTSLTVDRGGAVALVWQQGPDRTQPAASPGSTQEVRAGRPKGTSADVDPEPAALPGWLAPGAVVAVLLAIAAVVVARRRRAAP